MTERRLQAVQATTEQPHREFHIPTRLSECGETLSIRELCGVLGISKTDFYRRKAHHDLPVRPLKQFPHRFAKVQVQRFLERGV